jgi:hypothetical protein
MPKADQVPGLRRLNWLCRYLFFLDAALDPQPDAGMNGDRRYHARLFLTFLELNNFFETCFSSHFSNLHLLRFSAQHLHPAEVGGIFH